MFELVTDGRHRFHVRLGIFHDDPQESVLVRHPHPEHEAGAHSDRAANVSSPDLIALDDALEALAELDARRSQLIELRFFGGLTVEETAVVLKVAPDTVMRDSQLAKAWLARELSSAR